MVNNDLFDNSFFLSYSDAKEITTDFMNKNLSNFALKEAENYGMGFSLKYWKENTTIVLFSDRGDLSYRLLIDDNEIELYKFEPLLSNIEWFSSKNIMFLLTTIKRYLADNS